MIFTYGRDTQRVRGSACTWAGQLFNSLETVRFSIERLNVQYVSFRRLLTECAVSYLLASNYFAYYVIGSPHFHYFVDGVMGGPKCAWPPPKIRRTVAFAIVRCRYLKISLTTSLLQFKWMFYLLFQCTETINCSSYYFVVLLFLSLHCMSSIFFSISSNFWSIVSCNTAVVVSVTTFSFTTAS